MHHIRFRNYPNVMKELGQIIEFKTMILHFSRMRYLSDVNPAYSLNQAEEMKRSRYGSLSQELAIEFHPMTFDMFGSIGSGTEKGVHQYVRSCKEQRSPSTVDNYIQLLIHTASSL